MEPERRSQNKKSTPVENVKGEPKNHVNQSTEENRGGNLGWIAIVIIIAIIVLGILFFTYV